MIDFSFLNDPVVKMFITGVFLAGYGYITRTSEKDFSLTAFLSTVLTGVLVVVALLSSGVTVITEAPFVLQMGLFVSVTYAIQRALDNLFLRFSKKPAVQAFVARPQGTTDATIRFSIQYLGSRITPVDVMFTALTDGITRWNFGDGGFGYFDQIGQKTIIHRYLKDGTFQVRAFVGSVMSEPQEVTILSAPGPEPKPVKENWLSIFIRLVRAFLHI